MSSSKPASHAVVAWERKGEEVLPNELVEVVLFKKLIVLMGHHKLGPKSPCNIKMSFGWGRFYLIMVSLTI